MTGEQRYRFFLSRVFKENSLWILKNSDGWVLLGNNASDMIFPVWPDDSSAKKYASAIWEDCKEVKITLSRYFEELENLSRKRACSCMVFPTESAKGITVNAERLKKDIAAVAKEDN